MDLSSGLYRNNCGSSWKSKSDMRCQLGAYRMYALGVPGQPLGFAGVGLNITFTVMLPSSLCNPYEAMKFNSEHTSKPTLLRGS